MVDLSAVAHRPWPMPDAPYVMYQSWNDFLFCHWPVDVDALRAVVPPELPLDLWEGRAWLGVIPFRMEGVRLRGIPAFPTTGAFPELNVRTYVVVDGKPGVYFLSLDAASALVVRVARAWYRLPYFDADMRVTREADGWIRYESVRTHVGAPPARWTGRYRPRPGTPRHAQPGTFEHWLCERYCLYVVDGRRRVLRADIHHAPWPILDADLELDESTLPASHGLVCADTAPHVLYSPGVDSVAWRPIPA